MAGLRILEANALKGFRAVVFGPKDMVIRVENPISPGTPDLHYLLGDLEPYQTDRGIETPATGWIEAKVGTVGRVGPKKGLCRRQSDVTQNQIRFAERCRGAGGLWFMFLAVGRIRYLSAVPDDLRALRDGTLALPTSDVWNHWVVWEGRVGESHADIRHRVRQELCR